MGERYVLPGDVAVVAQDDVVYVARLPHGPILALDGSAAEIWRAVTGPPADGDWLARLAALYAVPVQAISGDAEAFVADLAARGLLTHQGA